MLNVPFSAVLPLTGGGKLDIIHLVSIRSLAPGCDMSAEVLTTPSQEHCYQISGPMPGMGARVGGRPEPSTDEIGGI